MLKIRPKILRNTWENGKQIAEFDAKLPISRKAIYFAVCVAAAKSRNRLDHDYILFYVHCVPKEGGRQTHGGNSVNS